jgi:L-amino acid N-acyltransferase YncA
VSVSAVGPAAADAATIRVATRADWDAIAALLTACGLPLAGAQAHLDDFLVAARDGALVGCAGLERRGAAALLRSVAVAPGARGAGLGVALTAAAIARAREGSADTLVLLTTTADRFFPRFGFRVVARDEVPDALRASEEFRGACPAGAIAMRLDLAAGGDAGLVRAARREDAAAIAAIYNDGIAGRMATFETRPRSADDVAAWFAEPRYPRLVAERGGRVVGWVAASGYRPRDCYAGVAEFSVYVAASERGRGVGDALMRHFLPACEAAGFWKVLSRIFPENTVSRALCRRHGFREVGTYARHGRLDGAWRDVVIVERLLGEALAEAARP